MLLYSVIACVGDVLSVVLVGQMSTELDLLCSASKGNKIECHCGIVVGTEYPVLNPALDCIASVVEYRILHIEGNGTLRSDRCQIRICIDFINLYDFLSTCRVCNLCTGTVYANITVELITDCNYAAFF